MANHMQGRIPCYISVMTSSKELGSHDGENHGYVGFDGSSDYAIAHRPIRVNLPDVPGEGRTLLQAVANYCGSDDGSETSHGAGHAGNHKDAKYRETCAEHSGITRMPDFEGLPHYRLDARVPGSSSTSPLTASSTTCEICKCCGKLINFTVPEPDNWTVVSNPNHQPKPATPEGTTDAKPADKQPSPAPIVPEKYTNYYFCIQPSTLGGLGAFAVRNIRRGTVILAEKALFHANERNLYDVIDKLSPDLQSAYLRLHAHYEKPNVDQKTAIFRTNSFSTRRGMSIFLVASRFNNACPPRQNITYNYHKAKGCLVFTAKDDIPKGKELTIHYGGQPRSLFLKWGFRCACGACKPLTDAQCADLTNSCPNWH